MGFKPIHIFVTLVAMACLFSGCGQKPSGSDASADDPTPAVENDGRPLVIGVISTDPADAIIDKQPLADYLASGLQDHGIGSGAVKVSLDMETMGRWMASGEVDIFLDSFYPAAVVSDLSGATPIAYRQRAKRDKSAVFFTVVESGINTMEDLLGEVVVLEEPDSTSGYMLPLFYLLEAGHTITEKQNPADEVASDEIGIVFSWDDDAVVQWVLTGRAKAGVAQDNTYEDFDEANPGQLVALQRTEPVMRDQPVLLQAGADSDLRESVASLFLSMGESEEGRALLEEIETSRFAVLDADREFDRARAQEMFDRVQEMDAE